jgi:hypothetical protein
LYFSSGWIWRIGPYLAMAAWIAGRVRGSAILKMFLGYQWKSRDEKVDLMI